MRAVEEELEQYGRNTTQNTRPRITTAATTMTNDDDDVSPTHRILNALALSMIPI